MPDKSLKRRRRSNKDGGGKKETVKLNTDVEPKFKEMAKELADTPEFRNITHVVEVAIEELYKSRKKED